MNFSAPNWVKSAVAACALAASTVCVQAQSGPTAYIGARLIDGRGGPVLENATVVVDGDKIVAAGASSTVQVPAGARRVDVAGKTIMPMIIDTHVHLSQSREGIQRDLKWRAWFGVSTVLSAGTDKYENLALPLIAIPGIKLDSGRSWPASGLAEAERRPVQTLAARSSLARADGSQARNAA